MTMEPKRAPDTELKLIRQVGEWAEYNFGPRREPALGVIEEIGEAAHCLLKRLQGIRGFDKPEFFYEKYGDALADCVIFLADWCSLNNAYFQLSRCETTVRPNQDIIFHHLLTAAGSLYSDYAMTSLRPGDTNPIYSSVAQRILQGLMFLALQEEIDLRMMVASTWAKVQNRNWKAKPKDAHKGNE